MYIFNIIYPNTGNLNLHFWKYLNPEFFRKSKNTLAGFDHSTSHPLVTHYASDYRAIWIEYLDDGKSIFL